MLGSFIFFCSGLAFLYVFCTVRSILAASPGNAAMIWITSAIQEGAAAYLVRQYKTIAVVMVIFAALFCLFLPIHGVLGFLLGAVLSGFTGYIGMRISIRCSGAVAQAARRGMAPALRLAFQGGAVTGLLLVGLAILGTGAYYLHLRDIVASERDMLTGLLSFGFGASFLSIFARMSGGIFAKGANLGTNLASQIISEIPKNDPRNPAVIADTVGHCVGDCVGMAADFFETYVVTLTMAMALGAVYTRGDLSELFMLYPLVIAGASIIGSIVGTFFVRLVGDKSPMTPLCRGLWSSGIVSFLLMAGSTVFLLGFDTYFDLNGFIITGGRLVLCTLIGVSLTIGFFYTAAYHTETPNKSLRPMALSMEPCALPIFLMAAGIVGAYACGGMYGIAIAATSMASFSGMAAALNAYGPIINNADGIANMAGLPNDVRLTTHGLDAACNTVKSATKGYAIGSAGLTGVVLFAVYAQYLTTYFPDLSCIFSLNDPYVVIGLFMGAALSYSFGATGIGAVYRAAGQIRDEVCRQLNEMPGIIDGAQRPHYGKAVDLLTKTALFEMIVPSLLLVLAPPVMGCVIFLTSGYFAAFSALGGLLMGVLVTGISMAISMTTGGGVRGNGGDPCKDAVAPPMNTLIKIVPMVAILLLTILAGAR